MGESIMQIYEQLVIYAQQDRANPSVYLFMGYRKKRMQTTDEIVAWVSNVIT